MDIPSLSQLEENNDGGPAFPFVDQDTNMEGATLYRTWAGMSLRDWFAGQAAIGILAGSPRDPLGAVAAKAYELADELLEARE